MDPKKNFSPVFRCNALPATMYKIGLLKIPSQDHCQVHSQGKKPRLLQISWNEMKLNVWSQM